jgi:HPt (histidine-containing phosphotransfer) domain-containing protein
MKLRLCLFLWLSLLVTVRGLAQTEVVDGVLDLRGQSLSESVDLRGDWAFYWQQHRDPRSMNQEVEGRRLLKVPGSWYHDKRHDLTAFGYGTYHLRILLDRPEALALALSEIWAASRIFLNGQELAVYGRPGTSAAEAKGGTGMSFFVLPPTSTTLDLVIHASNYEIFLSGLTKMPRLGPVALMQSQRDRQLAIDIVVIGALLIMSVYHLCLFALRTEDKSTLCFAIVCFFVAAYTATVGAEALITIWPDISYAWRLKVLNFSWMAATVAFIWFCWILFHPHFKTRVAVIGSWLACPHLLLCLSSEPRVFVNMSLVFQFLVVPILGHAFWAVWKSRHERRKISGIFLTGTIVLVLVVVNDIFAIQRRLNMPQLAGVGVLGFILVQSYLLAHRFSMAFVRLKESERDVRKLSENLKEVNENLEQTVEEKTRDIRSIMQHIPLGIFMMSGPDGVIARDYSQHLTQIFLQDKLEGLKAAELLFAKSQLSADEKSQALSAIQASLNELDINFDANRDFLPLHLQRQSPDGSQQLFDLTWDGIVNEAGITEKILVTIRDVTELRGLQLKALVHQEELEMIGEILNVEPARFNRFMQSAFDLLEDNERLLKQVEAGARDADLFQIIFINLHTLKGSARSFYFKALTALLHIVEQYYAGLTEAAQADLQRMQRDQQELRQMVERYDHIARDKLGRAPTDRMRVDFNLEDVQSHLEALQKLMQDESISQDVRQQVMDYSSRLMGRFHTPVKQTLQEITSILPPLARDLRKEKPELDLDDQGLLVPPQTEDLLHRVFVHLLRNSMDHGIESPEERQRKQKNRVPTLFIHFEAKKDRVLIHYWDDGRGLNLQRLREQALKNQLLSADETQNPQRLADLLLSAHLSTAQAVTDISGRGVGMDAIRRFVERAGGRVSIRLQSAVSGGYAPFRIEMDLPAHLFVHHDRTNSLPEAS